MDIKYPNITVELTGIDGNVFSIMGAVRRALESNEVPADDIKAFSEKCMSGDYDNVLRTCMETVNVE